MSKPYRIQVQDAISVSDCSTFQIDSPPLATRQEFSNILEEVMEEAGWKRDEEDKLCFDLGEEQQYIFYPETMQIKTLVLGQEEINEELEGWTPQAVNEQADKMLENRERQLRERITQKLEENKEERKLQLESLVVDATGRALKEAAQRLGDVQEINEERSEDGTYRLTISIQERE